MNGWKNNRLKAIGACCGLILLSLIGCSAESPEDGESEILLPPQIHQHRNDIPDDLWGPDALTDTDGVYIEWEASTEADLAGYQIYRTTHPAGGYKRIDKVPKTVTFYEDRDVRLETRYYYRVTASDQAGNESKMSEPVYYTPLRKPIPVSPSNHAMLNTPPTFRWLGLGETGFYTLRVFVDTEDPEQPFREIWRYETIDFDQFAVRFNQDGRATESVLPGQEYRWRVDFKTQATVGSESTWHFFRYTLKTP